jgi:hypothetical protein
MVHGQKIQGFFVASLLRMTPGKSEYWDASFGFAREELSRPPESPWVKG